MDSITLNLNKEDAGNIDLLAEIPLYLTNISEHNYGTGLIVGGRLGNLKVSVNESRVKIENSLTKYYLGNNLQMMRRCDIKSAIQKISDEIHLPVNKASVRSFDFAKNIILEHNVPLYFNYLGNNTKYARYQSKAGLNYKLNGKEVSIYDKIAELKHSREPVPELYNGKNVMRIESRYLQRIAKHFNRSIITASTLHNEAFYMAVNIDWYKDYCRINKLKKFKIDMSMIFTKKQYYETAALTFINEQGGELAALQNINERYKKGELTKKQAHDLRELVKECCKLKLQTCHSVLIIELDKKVKEAVRYYR